MILENVVRACLEHPGELQLLLASASAAVGLLIGFCWGSRHEYRRAAKYRVASITAEAAAQSGASHG